LYHLGDAAASRTHLEQGLALYDPQQHRHLAFLYGQDLGMSCLCYTALDLWHLGYPDQALRHSQEGLTRARELSHPFSLAWALSNIVFFHLLRRERRIAQELNKEAIALCTEQGFTLYVAAFTLFQGSLLAAQGQGEEGIAQIQQGLAAWRAAGAEAYVPCWLAFLAEAYGQMERVEEGLATLAEALTIVHKNRDEVWKAELYRLKGQLTLQQLSVASSQLSVTNPQSPIPNPQTEAEACFQQAIDIARQQGAKLWELRATTRLSRLWLQQGKPAAARQLLAEVYGWFTEGFETPDLQEARALLEELTNTMSSLQN
jgi:predicted ATPase